MRFHSNAKCQGVFIRLVYHKATCNVHFFSNRNILIFKNGWVVRFEKIQITHRFELLIQFDAHSKFQMSRTFSASIFCFVVFRVW